MNEYEYTTVVTVVSFDYFGETVSEEWEGLLSKEDTDFAVHKLLADNYISDKYIHKVKIEQLEVTRNMGYDPDDLYGGGNCLSASGDYYSTGAWANCQY